MERDFLGVIGKESGSLSKDDGRDSRTDSVTYANGSGMQWPFASNSPPLQFSISGFQPKSDNPTPTLSPQQQYGIRGYRHPDSTNPNANGSGVAPVGPFAQINPFVKNNNGSGSNQQNNTVTPLKQNSYSGGAILNNHFVGSTTGVFPTRDLPKPGPTAQLTIFYAGSVCSFDNIPVDKAREILMMASKASTLSIDTPKLEPPVNNNNNNNTPDTCKIMNLPLVSSSASLVSQTNNNNNNRSLSRSGSSSNNSECNLATRPLSPLGPTCQSDAAAPSPGGAPIPADAPTPSLASGLADTTATAIMTRAVPQARKASLARFLEKRKERVSSVALSPCNQNISENCENSENSNLSMKRSKSKGLFELKNCEDSFSFSQSTTHNSYYEEALNTKLEI